MKELAGFLPACVTLIRRLRRDRMGYLLPRKPRRCSHAPPVLAPYAPELTTRDPGPWGRHRGRCQPAGVCVCMRMVTTPALVRDGLCCLGNPGALRRETERPIPKARYGILLGNRNAT